MSATKDFFISAVATAGTGELLSTQITGTDTMDIILKILIPLISGVIAPAITKLVDAWVYKIKNSNKQTKHKNDANEESKNEKEKGSES